MNHPKSELLSAIEVGDSQRALQVLAAGADPHGTPASPPPLHIAARLGDAIVAAALIEGGADMNAQFPYINMPSTYGNGLSYESSVTALMEAASTNLNPVLPLLLAAGADVNARSDSGGTALIRATFDIFSNPQAGPENAQLLLEAGANPNLPNYYHRTPLWCALDGFCQHSSQNTRSVNHALLQLLLDYGADPNTLITEGASPVHSVLERASRRRDLASVLMLIEAGASVHNADVASLWLLSKSGESEQHNALRAILQAHGLSPNAQQQGEKLRDAAAGGANEHVRLLLESGADANGLAQHSDKPLHLAATHSHIEVVNELLRHGADPNIRRTDLSTPLHRAAAGKNSASVRDLEFVSNSQRNLMTVRTLLQAGAEVNATTASGHTPLHFAVKRATPAVVAALLGAGALVNARNQDNRTPLHKFLARSRRQQLLLDKPQILSYVFRHTHSSTQYPFDNQVRSEWQDATDNDLETLRLLIEHGADVNAPDFDTYTPLQTAAQFMPPEAVQMLLDAGAEVNSLRNGFTALDLLLALGRTYITFKTVGFALRDFPDVRDQLRTAAHDPDIAMDTLLPDAETRLQFAAREDVAAARTLIKAGGLYSSQIQ